MLFIVPFGDLLGLPGEMLEGCLEGFETGGDLVTGRKRVRVQIALGDIGSESPRLSDTLDIVNQPFGKIPEILRKIIRIQLCFIRIIKGVL